MRSGTMAACVLVVALAAGGASASLMGQDTPLPAVQSPSVPYPPPLPAIPEGERRDDKYRDDPHARCMRPEVVEYYPDNPSLHACTCHLMCSTLPDGHSEQAEASDCALNCSKQRCACHPDDPCNRVEVMGGPEEPKADDGNPFDGTVVPR